MLKPETLARLGQQITQRVTQAGDQAPHELQKNIQALLRSSFDKLDLVTREEFDVQKEILARTRAKVDELEKQVQVLETRLQQQAQAADADNEPPSSLA